MCGIAGWIDYADDLTQYQNTQDKMMKTMEHRGPDDQGRYITYNAVLLHRRLSVVDPENGRQPMIRSRDGAAYIITYNGELYNTDELRAELAAAGYTFEGHSDTEVLLYAYIEWGEACVDKLNGIYAFGIYSEQDRRLFLCRDRVGVKPLFYFNYPDGLLFASEIKTLLANLRVKPVIEKEGLYDLLLLGPGRTPGFGVFKDIYELRPGECAVFDSNGFRKRTYWRLTAGEHRDNALQTIEKTRALLTDAIRRQLISDVPLCCFLSGGLDSSIITKVAADEFKNTGRGPLGTWSVDYAQNRAYFKSSLFTPDTDNQYIAQMVEFTGSQHHEVILDNPELAEALRDAVRARDLPGMADIDSSLLLFCREIKKQYTVALSGECADELFGGYPWYHNEEMLSDNTFPWSRSLSFRKSLFKPGVLGSDCDDYVHERYLDTVRNTDKLSCDGPREARMREMFSLNFYWFMQTLLSRKDHMSMYSGLEVRVPFCDWRLVEYAYNMPWDLKSSEGREKCVIRKAVSDLLPNEIVWRKKSPYPKTHNPEYFGIVRDKIYQVLQDKNSVLTELVDKDTLDRLVSDPDALKQPWYGQLMTAPQILAYLLQLEYWFEEYGVIMS